MPEGNLHVERDAHLSIATTDTVCPTYRTGQAYLAEFEQTGCEQAFEEIVRLYAGMVYSVCNQVTKNNHDAEDATQATFLALATQVKTGKQVKYLGPWLRQVAKRTALDLRKSRKRREKREETHGAFSSADKFNGNAGEANLQADEYKQALHDELNRLPPRYREPLMMHYFGGLRPEETAVELNCKPKTLAVRLHRGRKMLAESLSKRGLFINAEMLGASAFVPLIGNFLGRDGAHATAHAASSLVTGQDVTQIITERVMSLVRRSAKAVLFAKIKFALVLMIGATTFLAGSAQAVRAIAPSLHLSLPSLKFNVGDWVRPMLRSFTSAPKITASAQPVKSHHAGDNQTGVVRFGMLADASLLPQNATEGKITFASFDVSGAADAVPVAMLLPVGNEPIGPIDLTSGNATLSTAVANGTLMGDGTVVMPQFGGEFLSVDSAGRLITRRSGFGATSPTPEPASLMVLALGGGLLFRRRK